MSEEQAEQVESEEQLYQPDYWFWRDGKCIELDEDEAELINIQYVEKHSKDPEEFTDWDDVIAHNYAQYKHPEPLVVFTEDKDPASLRAVWYKLCCGDYIKIDHIEMCPAYNSIHVSVTVLNTCKFLTLEIESFEEFASLFRAAGSDSLDLLHYEDDQDRYILK